MVVKQGNGVGVTVNEVMCEIVLEVKMVSDRVMAIKMIWWSWFVGVIQKVAGFEWKWVCYDEFIDLWDMHSVLELVVYFVGHVCQYIDGYNGANGGCCESQKNLELRMLLMFYLKKRIVEYMV